MVWGSAMVWLFLAAAVVVILASVVVMVWMMREGE
jgi:hypothetical protein